MSTSSINTPASVSDYATISNTPPPETFRIANVYSAPVSATTVAQVEQTQSGKQEEKLIQLPTELLLSCLEEVVRLAPGKMPETLAGLRKVCKVFCGIADHVERSTKDIAHASTARKIRNVMFPKESPHLRKPTLQALFPVLNHIAVSLLGITKAEDRFMLLKALAAQRDKGSLSLDLHDVQSGELDYLRRIAENNPTASIELNLWGSTLSPIEIKELLRPFAQHQSLVKLSLCKTRLDREGFEDMLPTITRFSKLTTLKFNHVMSGFLSVFIPETMRSLAKTVIDLKSLAELELSSDCIGADAMHELAAVAEQLPPIKHLILRDAFFYDEGMNQLCSILRSLRSSIESLDFGNTGMHGDSARVLAGVLPELEHLKLLSLDGNMFSSGSMQPLIPVLAVHPSMEEFSLAGSTGVDYGQIKSLVEALAGTNRSLRHLTLDWPEARLTGEACTSELRPMLEKIASLRTATLPAHGGTLKKIELMRN